MWQTLALGYKILRVSTSRPTCGMISIAMPAFAILIGFAGLAFLHAFAFVRDQPDWPVPIIALLCLIAGTITGIMGISRKEPCRWLSVLGVVFNSSLIILGFIMAFAFPAVSIRSHPVIFESKKPNQALHTNGSPLGLLKSAVIVSPAQSRMLLPQPPRLRLAPLCCQHPVSESRG